MRIGFMMGYERERADFASKNGFRCCELKVSPSDEFFPGKDGWQDRALEVKKFFGEKNMRISCIAGFYVNCMEKDREEEHKKLVRDVITLAERMSVPVVAGFPGRVEGKPLEESLPQYAEMWGELAKFAEDRNIRIAFENCPFGSFHTPCGGKNFMCTPEMWERAFNELSTEAIGLEWDPSHLVCNFIDPVANLRKFGKRVYHVHAKDAHVNRHILKTYGIWHHLSIEHCFAGFGDTDWNLVIKELYRQGYENDLNIEGFHDSVFRDGGVSKREDEGLIISRRYLEQFFLQE